MKKFLKRMLLILIGFALITAFNKVRFHYGWKEAMIRTVMTPFTGTVWSERYSETAFSKIQIGIQKQEVVALLGEPLDKRNDEDKSAASTWIYSNQDTPTADYDRRWISFGPNGLVNHIRHEFYID